MHKPSEVPLAAKVEFLKKCDPYPDFPVAIEAIETHFAWVFLSNTLAYKLKKPIKFRDIDLVELDARKSNCGLEVTLNRRLAAPTYLDIVPLTMSDAKIELEGAGEAIEWLVKMRRLPAERMLITAADDKTITTSELRALVTKLSGFYRSSDPAPWGAATYPDRLSEQIRDYGHQLSAPEFQLEAPAVEKLVSAQCNFIARRRELLETRAELGRVVDAHGDLRPEHVFLVEDPQIIDCLEFRPELRLLDAAAEIVFLALECERMEHRTLAENILKLYLDIADDPAEPALLDFYRSIAALGRALVSAWHVVDIEPAAVEPWIRRANWYLDAAQTGIDDAAF